MEHPFPNSRAALSSVPAVEVRSTYGNTSMKGGGSMGLTTIARVNLLRTGLTDPGCFCPFGKEGILKTKMMPPKKY